MSWSSALVSTNYYIVHLGFGTVPVSSGAGSATLTLGWGVENPVPWPSQVCIYLNILDVHFADISEGG